MKRKDIDETESIQEMNIEEVTIIHPNEIDGFTFDNPLFTQSIEKDDPFKHDFEEDNTIKENFYLGNDIDEVSEN